MWGREGHRNRSRLSSRNLGQLQSFHSPPARCRISASHPISQPFTTFPSMDSTIISAKAARQPRNGTRNHHVESTSARNLGFSGPSPPPTRSPTILGPQVGDQQGTRISDRNLEAKAVVCVRVCDWRDGTEQGSTAEVAGAQSTLTRGGRPERAPGRGAWRHGVPPLQDLSIEFSISTCPLSSSASLFPDPASIRARPCSAYPRVRR